MTEKEKKTAASPPFQDQIKKKITDHHSYATQVENVISKSTSVLGFIGEGAGLSEILNSAGLDDVIDVKRTTFEKLTST